MNLVRSRYLLLVVSAACPAPAAGQVLDPALRPVLAEIDRRAAGAGDLTARFEERKHTVLLKEPLVSRGVVLMLGSRIRWNTETPHPTVTIIDPHQVRIYYPERGVIEVYETGTTFHSPPVSPQPRLATLEEHFRIESLDLTAMDERLDRQRYVALRLTPRSESLGEHVEEVAVVIDRTTGFLQRAELTDADGDRTVLTFSQIRANTGLTEADLELKVPANVKVVHPLAAEAPASPEESSRP